MNIMTTPVQIKNISGINNFVADYLSRYNNITEDKLEKYKKLSHKSLTFDRKNAGRKYGKKLNKEKLKLKKQQIKIIKYIIMI